MLVVAAVQLVFAALLIARPPALLSYWPFPGTTELTYSFVASIFAAAGASTIWAALAGEASSYVGIALDYVAIFGPMTVFVLTLDPARGGGITLFAVLVAVTFAFGIWLLWWSGRAPMVDPRGTPTAVLIAFLGFTILLLLTSSALLVVVPNVLPWNVTTDLSRVVGFVFFGAATYFAFGLVRRRWSNAGGQLSGFLAYDVVLILPLASRLPTVSDAFRLSLVSYIAVLVVSGAVAVSYLFVNPATRVARRATPAPLPEPAAAG
jgi:hypothetical protein